MFTEEEIVEYMEDNGYDNRAIALFLYLRDEGELSDEDDYESVEDYVVDNDVTEGYDSDVFECNDDEYLVFDDYDSAYNFAFEQQEMLLDDIGFEGLNVDMSDFANQDVFREAFQEMNEGYASDIETESSDFYENRLIEECIDSGIISENDVDEDGYYTGNLDLVQELADYLTETIEDYAEEYAFQLGEDNFNEFVKHNQDAIDVDALIDYILRSDGIENTLASYDGYEIKYNFDGYTYYMYRTN